MNTKQKVALAVLTVLAALALTLVALAALHATGYLHIWEDWSWAIGKSHPWIVSGCAPWGICS